MRPTKRQVRISPNPSTYKRRPRPAALGHPRSTRNQIEETLERKTGEQEWCSTYLEAAPPGAALPAATQAASVGCVEERSKRQASNHLQRREGKVLRLRARRQMLIHVGDFLSTIFCRELVVSIKRTLTLSIAHLLFYLIPVQNSQA